jgi:hypothetical protein
MILKGFKIGLIVLLSLIGLQDTYAQDQPELKATTSKSKVAKNGRLRLEFTVNRQGADHFKAPNFTNFRVISGPVTSIKQTWVNGKSTYRQSNIYIVSPEKFGELTVGAAEIEFEGEILKSNRLKIQVVSESEMPKDPNDPEYIAKENVHMVTIVSDKTPYVGEGIYVEYRLYFSENIGLADAVPRNVPNYNGFWNEEIENKGFQLKYGEFNGEKYRYVTIKKSLLIPQRSGELIIDNMGVDISLQVPTNRADFFGNRVMNSLTKTFDTGKKIIRVKALPEEGKPLNFAGAVGSFDLSFTSDKKELKSNESVAVKVEVNGIGNLKLFEIPEISVPNELELYAPERKEKVANSAKGIKGSLFDEYILVPQKGGRYKIPSISFAYFDPKDKKYHELKSEDLFLTVNQGNSIQAINPGASSVDKKQVIVNDSFRYIATTTQFQPLKREAFFGSSKFYIWLLLPMIAIPIGIFFGNARAARAADLSGAKRRRADRLAKKYLSEAKKKIKDKEEFYGALERALHNYLKAKLAVETTDISQENIRLLLEGKQINSEAIDGFMEVFKDCEFARYTPITDLMIREEYDKAKKCNKFNRQTTIG